MTIEWCSSYDIIIQAHSSSAEISSHNLSGNINVSCTLRFNGENDSVLYDM